MQNITEIIERLEKLKFELLEIEVISQDKSMTEEHRLKVIHERIHAITMNLLKGKL